jgi:hypothetical protein
MGWLAMMSLKRWIALMALILLAMPGMAQHAVAQMQGPPIAGPGASYPPPRYGRPRIEINPRPLLYRRCIDWYELQYRPSGTVLYPQLRCWWVRG